MSARWLVLAILIYQAGYVAHAQFTDEVPRSLLDWAGEWGVGIGLLLLLFAAGALPSW